MANGMDGIILPVIIGSGFVLPGIVIMAAYGSKLNKLAFRMSLTEDQLEAAYRSYVSNHLASWAFVIALLGVMFPFFSFISLIQGLIALNRSQKGMRPQAKNRGIAVASIVLSAIGLLQIALVIMIIIVL